MVENTAAHDVELGSCAVKRRSDADRMLKWRNQCSEKNNKRQKKIRKNTLRKNIKKVEWWKTQQKMVENTAAHDVELGSCAVKRRSDADRTLKWRNQCSELKTARFMVDCRSLTHTLHVCMTRTNRTVYMPRPQWFETQKAKRSTLRGTLTACNKDKTRSCHLRWPSAFGSDDFRSVLIYVA